MSKIDRILFFVGDKIIFLFWLDNNFFFVNVNFLKVNFCWINCWFFFKIVVSLVFNIVRENGFEIKLLFFIFNVIIIFILLLLDEMKIIGIVKNLCNFVV